MIPANQNLFRLYLVAIIVTVVLGCRSGQKQLQLTSNIEPPGPTASVRHPGHIETAFASTHDLIAAASPRTSLTEIPSEFREISLDEAILAALENTEILRSLGATVLQNPRFAASSFDPAINSTDPNFGIDAALAQFDARFNSSLIYAKNDDVFNNNFLGGGATEVRDDVTLGQFSLNKTTATGAQFTLGNSIQHSQSNNTTNLFAHSWTTVWEATARQPLLQGRGVRFNRIAGPIRAPGFQQTSGVVLSRINHDISIAQFETRLREMINEIVEAYWQLELAYKNFEAIRRVRDSGLTTWNIAKARFDSDLPGGEADREAQAREQYYEFQSQLLEALNGDQSVGRTGVLQAEANLRRLLNLPQSDNHLLKPLDTPSMARTVFDWQQLANNTINSRVELREQLWRVKQRELQLEVANNFTLPRLDAIATYRNNGFGDDLAGGSGRFSSALRDAISNDHAEWEMGVTYDLPIGFRQAHSGVRNAELALGRERALLVEQQQQILHDLGTAVRVVDQRFANIELQANRLEAAQATVDSRNAAYEADAVGFDELLDAQRRLLQSELAYFDALANYEAAKTALMRESGRLLPEHGILLTEENAFGSEICAVKQ